MRSAKWSVGRSQEKHVIPSNNLFRCEFVRFPLNTLLFNRLHCAIPPASSIFIFSQQRDSIGRVEHRSSTFQSLQYRSASLSCLIIFEQYLSIGINVFTEELKVSL